MVRNFFAFTNPVCRKNPLFFAIFKPVQTFTSQNPKISFCFLLPFSAAGLFFVVFSIKKICSKSFFYLCYIIRYSRWFSNHPKALCCLGLQIRSFPLTSPLLYFFSLLVWLPQHLVSQYGNKAHVRVYDPSLKSRKNRHSFSFTYFNILVCTCRRVTSTSRI